MNLRKPNRVEESSTVQSSFFYAGADGVLGQGYLEYDDPPRVYKGLPPRRIRADSVL